MSEGQGGEGGARIREALSELRQEPYGKARSARTEELVEAAEQCGDDAALATALLELLTAYEYGDEVRKAPVLFNRILGLYKAKPEAFDERAVHSLFWCFKWITTSLLSLPEIPLGSVERWIALMSEHYTAAGKPMQAVHTSRYRLAAHTGVGADIAYDLWSTRPRDEFSDCEACEARTRGIHWLVRGDDVRALREWQPVLDGKLGCTEEPGATISRALLPLVRTGRHEEAVSFHRTGYRSTRGKVSTDAEVSRHLEFLALTGNTARGLEVLAENRGRFDSDGDAQSRLIFLDGIRVLLTQVAALDGSAPVAGPAGRSRPAAELLAEITAEADAIAAAFDARNGTTWQGDLHRARAARQPLTAEPLPLGVRVAVDGAAVPSAVPAPAAPVAPLPEEFETLLAQAREALEIGRPDSDRLWLAVAERATAADTDDLLRAELTDRAASRLMRKKAWSDAEAKLHEAATLFEGADKPGRAASRRGRAAWCVFMSAEDVQAASWDDLDAILAAADELQSAGRISPNEYAIVLHSRAAAGMRMFYEAGDEDALAAALVVVERELAAFREATVRLDLPARTAVVSAMTTTVLARQGRFEDALAETEAAIALAEKAGRPWDVPGYAVQRGQLLNRLNRLDDAATELHRAIALHGEWPDSDFDDANVLMELAQNRLAARDGRTAITHLTSAAAKFDQRGEEVPAANARAMLGQALLRSGRQSDAVAVFESLLDEPGEAKLIPEQRGQIRLELGRALMGQEEFREAASVFAALADLLGDWPDLSVKTLAVAELASALYAAQLWEQADKALDRAIAAHAEGPNAAAVCDMLRIGADSAARNLGAEGVERALELLGRADEVNLATEEVEGRYRRWPETAQTADVRTQVLAGADRDEEALAAAESAIAAWRLGENTLTPLAEATRVAAVLEGLRLGRRAAAADRVRPMIARCREEKHEQAVAVLSKLLADLGG